MSLSKEEVEKQVPRSYMSPAYVEKRDGQYVMYRDILVETDKPDGAGGFYREKLGRRIGPMMILRVAKDGEEIDFVTSMTDGTVLPLHRVYPPREQPKDPLLPTP
jgi:hypothetical protein